MSLITTTIDLSDMSASIDILVNDFAIRSFRDVADEDYISARMAFRARLIPQFFWASLQALEKYLKCMLVLNRIKANHGHALGEILAEFEKSKPFELRLSPPARRFITLLDTYGRHRYFESSWHVMGDEIVDLDRTVWDVRRYARVMQFKIDYGDGSKVDALPLELKRNADAESRHPQKFQIVGGRLESILAKRTHPAREPLVWQNGFYGKSNRRNIKIKGGMQGANSPLALRPEILDEVLKYAWLPKDVKEAYRQRAGSTP